MAITGKGVLVLEIRIIRMRVAAACQRVLQCPPSEPPAPPLRVLPAPKKYIRGEGFFEKKVKKLFLAQSLRDTFSGAFGSCAIAVMSYARSSYVTNRIADKSGRRIRYGVDASGPYKKVSYGRDRFLRRRVMVKRISFEELLYFSRDPEVTYLAVMSVLLEGADRILGKTPCPSKKDGLGGPRKR